MAAAAALHLIETGQVTARGSLSPILRAGPCPPVYDGDPPDRFTEPDRPANSWQAAITSLRDIADTARRDPQTARQLLALLTGFSRTQAGYDRIREPMIDRGIPAEFLPTYQEISSPAPPS